MSLRSKINIWDDRPNVNSYLLSMDGRILFMFMMFISKENLGCFCVGNGLTFNKGFLMVSGHVLLF